MSIDLGAILDTAAPLVASALATSGTVVDMVRETDAAPDPVTLKVSKTRTTIESDLPAIITALSRSNTRDDGPDRPADVLMYVVSVDASVTTPLIDDIVIPSASRDQLLVGARLVIRSVGFDVSGMLRQMVCEHQPVRQSNG